MKAYRVIGTFANVPPGTVVGFVNPDQLRRRQLQMESLGRGLYRALETLQFKRGEIFGSDGEVPKAMAELLEPVEPPARERRSRPAKSEQEPLPPPPPPPPPGGEDTGQGAAGDGNKSDVLL